MCKKIRVFLYIKEIFIQKYIVTNKKFNKIPISKSQFKILALKKKYFLFGIFHRNALLRIYGAVS